MQPREIETLLFSEDVISMGKKLLKTGRYEAAIQYLEPKGDTNNIEIAYMLAQAYKNVNTNPVKTFSYLKIVRTEARKSFLANPSSLTLQTNSGHVFLTTLIDMVTHAPTRELSEMLFKEGIDTIQKHPLTFHGKVKIQFLYTLHHNIGIALRKFAGQVSQEESPLGKHLMEKSINFFKEALKYQTNDIQTVLCIAATFVELDTDAQRGLEYLLPFQKTFEKNPYYHHALYVLYDLKNNEKASKKHHDLFIKLSGFANNQGLLTLFTVLLPDSDSPIGRALLKFNNKQFEEAKKIVDFILEETPDDIEAIELSAEIALYTRKIPQALSIANEILAINPNSKIGLKVKASCLWQTGNLKSRKVATAMCDDLYKKGYRTNFVLNMLVCGASLQDQHDKVISYGTILARTAPSAYLYYTLGMTYFGLSDYENAFLYLNKLHKEYSTYKPTDVLEALIAAKFLMAESKKALRECGKLIAAYLDLLGDQKPTLGMTLVINELQNSHSYIRFSMMNDADEAPEAKSDECDNAPYKVPPEIKAYILEAISKKSFREDNDPCDGLDTEESDDDFNNELQEMKPADIKPIGDSGKLFCFLSQRARVKLNPVEINKCETVLENGELLAKTSKNTSGHKMLDDRGEKYKIKMMGTGMRVHGRSRFFQEGVPRLSVPEGGSIVRYKDVVRNHKKSCKV